MRKNILNYLVIAGFAVATAFTGCKKETVDGTNGPDNPDPEKRIAKINLYGERIKEFDVESAIDSVLTPEVIKLLLLADDKFNWTPKEDAAAEMSWLRGKVEKLIAVSELESKVIDGDGTFMNPRAISDADSTFFANLNFYVYRYSDEVDECDSIKTLHDGLKHDFQVMKDSCLKFYLIECFEKVPWYQEAYEFHLPRDDSLKACWGVQQMLIDAGIQYPDSIQKFIDAAARTGLLALAKQEYLEAFEEEHDECLTGIVGINYSKFSTPKGNKQTQNKHAANAYNANVNNAYKNNNAYNRRTGVIHYRNGR
jgi:hypothetical protein